MSKIHFVSLFGVELDYDIATFWRDHHLSHLYDTYTVYLHCAEPPNDKLDILRGGFEQCGFSVRVIQSVEYTTQLRNETLESFAKSLPADDYLVVADSDEFHYSGRWYTGFRDLIQSCDVLEGMLIDRWDKTLHEATCGTPLDVQYPKTGNLFELIKNRSDDPMKDRWRVPNPHKIIAARAGYPVAYAGNHVLYKKPDGAKIRRGVNVHHYRWRHNIAQRLQTKWYHSLGYERAILDFFGCGVTHED